MVDRNGRTDLVRVAQESPHHQPFAGTNPIAPVGLVVASEEISLGEGFSAVPDLHQTDTLSRGARSSDEATPSLDLL